MSGYDLWLSEPYMEEEEGCTCAGLYATFCPVHDHEDDDSLSEDEIDDAVNLDAPASHSS